MGTTGEIMPASLLPFQAKQRGATIIEINPAKSQYTDRISDIYIKGKAGEILPKIVQSLKHILNRGMNKKN